MYFKLWAFDVKAPKLVVSTDFHYLHTYTIKTMIDIDVILTSFLVPEVQKFVARVLHAASFKGQLISKWPLGVFKLTKGQK